MSKAQPTLRELHHSLGLVLKELKEVKSALRQIACRTQRTPPRTQAALQPKETKTGLATIQQAADYLKLHRHTIRSMLNDGRLPCVPFKRYRRIPWDAIYRFESADTNE